MQNMVILGATGSIGASTLSVVARNPEQYKVFALVANTNVAKMLEICNLHQSKIVHMVDVNAARALKAQLPAHLHL